MRFLGKKIRKKGCKLPGPLKKEKEDAMYLGGHGRDDSLNPLYGLVAVCGIGVDVNMCRGLKDVR